jgi:hypothetical protein
MSQYFTKRRQGGPHSLQELAALWMLPPQHPRRQRSSVLYRSPFEPPTSGDAPNINYPENIAPSGAPAEPQPSTDVAATDTATPVPAEVTRPARPPRQRVRTVGPSLVEAMHNPELFGNFFEGESWSRWMAILKACEGAPLSPPELAYFEKVAGQRKPPTEPVREIVVCGGRRGGKDSVASVMVVHSAVFFSDGDKLRPGEQALCLLLARDKDQAQTVLKYIKAIFKDIPALREMVTRETRTGLELVNNVVIEVMTNDHRAVRGRTLLFCCMDEVAHWQTQSPTISPDLETYRAVIPSLATLPSAKLIMISTPFGKRGLLHQRYTQYFGKDDPDVLVIQASSLTLNPALDARLIEEDIVRDPEGARAEWLGEFRDDVSGFVTREVIEASIDVGVLERSPIAGLYYFAFVDPAGGAGSDSMTLAIGHLQDGNAVIDVVREVRPPFSPEQVTAEFAELIKKYGIRAVVGDDFGNEWCKEQFRKRNIWYEPSTRNRSELYLESLSYFNSRKVRLLDHKKTAAQFCDLVRTTSRTGRDGVNHPPNGHDDCSNVVAGVIVHIMARIQRTQFVRIPGFSLER